MSKQKNRATAWIFGAAALLVVVVVVVLGYTLLRGQRSATEPSLTPAYQVGQLVEVGGVEFTVVRSYESRGTDSERPKLQNIFTIARVSLTNKTGQPIEVRLGDFTLLVDGQEIPLKPMSYVINSLTDTTLEPGATVEGALSWENSTRYETKVLRYTSPDGQAVTVDLLKKPE